MLVRIATTLLTIALLQASVSAQSAQITPRPSVSSELGADGLLDSGSLASVTARLDALEAENRFLRQALTGSDALSGSDRSARVPALPAAHREVCDGSPSGCDGAGCREDCGWIDRLSEACKGKLSWNLGNGWRIKPFGQLRGDAIYSQAPQTADALIIFLNPRQPGIDEDQATVHGKATELFFQLTGPTYGTWQTGGLIAINFLGPQPIRNQSGANIVNAYGEIKNDKWGFRFGRMLDLFGPLNPTTVNYIAHRGAGNIGIFRGAFNVDRYITLSESHKWTCSARIAQQNILDYTVIPQIRGKDAGWPNIEARVGVELGCIGDNGRPISLGLSGFIGETQAIEDAVIDNDFVLLGADDVNQSRGAAIDFQFNGARAGMRGEGWWGNAAGTYFVATLQTTDPMTNNPIESVGGWLELYYKCTAKTTLHGGYGVDDPLDSRLGFLDDSDLIGQIRFNDVAWINAIHNVTDSIQLGFEVSHRDTKFVESTFDNSGWVFHMMSALKY